MCRLIFTNRGLFYLKMQRLICILPSIAGNELTTEIQTALSIMLYHWANVVVELPWCWYIYGKKMSSAIVISKISACVQDSIPEPTLAQSVEHQTSHLKVVGSVPLTGYIFYLIFELIVYTILNISYPNWEKWKFPRSCHSGDTADQKILQFHFMRFLPPSTSIFSIVFPPILGLCLMLIIKCRVPSFTGAFIQNVSSKTWKMSKNVIFSDFCNVYPRLTVLDQQ